MLSDPITRDRLVAEWRAGQSDPERRARFDRHALDILVDATCGDRVSDSFAALSDAEQVEYMAYVASTLGEMLGKVVAFWLLNECPTIEDWQRDR